MSTPPGPNGSAPQPNDSAPQPPFNPQQDAPQLPGAPMNPTAQQPQFPGNSAPQPVPGVAPQLASTQPGYPGQVPPANAGAPSFANPQQVPAASGFPGTGYPYPGAPVGMTAQPVQKSKKGLWIILAGVAAALVLALILFSVFAKKPDATTAGGGSGNSTATPAEKLDPKELAKKTVEDYFKALSEGRGADALALLDTSSIDDTSLLTDAVLKDSNTRAPMTDVVIGDLTGSTSYFTSQVAYKLGGKEGGAELSISVDKAIGKAKITMGATKQLSLYDMKGLKPSVNGVEAKTERPAIFPGSYNVTVGSKYLSVTGTNPYVLTSLTGSEYPNLKVEVNQDGVAMFRQKVTAEAEACLASKALDPGCNMPIASTTSDGTQVRDGSITRTQDDSSKKKFETLEPKLDYSSPGVISAWDLGTFNVTAECSEGGKWTSCKLYGFAKGLSWPKPTIDLMDPELPVVWQN